jgi:hypothetical protein
MPDVTSCGHPGKHHAHGWCQSCYMRWWYFDKPDTGPPPVGTRKNGRFADYLDIRSWDLRGASSFRQFASRAAPRLGLSERTVWRYEKRARELGVAP